MQRRVLLFLTILLLLAIPASSVMAAPLSQTVVEDEDVIRNDVVLLNDNFELKAGGKVNGDVILFNGTATIAGTVNGDVVLFNGNLEIADTAVLNGDCVLFNGSTSGEGASSYTCTSLDVALPNGVANLVNQLAEASTAAPVAPEVPQTSLVSRILGGTAWAVARALMLGLLAFAAASFFPQPMVRIEEAVRRRPLASGAIGLLTTFSMPFVMLTLALVSLPLILLCGLGLLGYPLIALLGLGMAVAGFLGWFTVGNIAGEFLAERLNLKNRSQAQTTALGTAAITFTIGFLGAIPFVIGESLLWLAIVFLGLGATALTKFGTRAYPLVAAPVLNQDKITAVLDTLPDKSNLDD